MVILFCPVNLSTRMDSVDDIMKTFAKSTREVEVARGDV